MLSRIFRMLYRSNGRIGGASACSRQAGHPSLPPAVAVLVDGKWTAGRLGEKVAGGLFEVIFKIENREVSGVFRLDELIQTSAMGESADKPRY